MSPRWRRREFVAAGAATLALARATNGRAADSAAPRRLALLLGERDYPHGLSLASMGQNVAELKPALVKRGFEVHDALDTDVSTSQALIRDFGARLDAAGDDAIAFFYFCGHGLQLDAKNLMVTAGVSLIGSLRDVERGSLELLAGVMPQLRPHPSGLRIAVVDACRVDVLARPAQRDGLNQVEAPEGTLIAFSTGAGKPALAPIRADQSTFYTASLAKHLSNESGEVTFSELFRRVSVDVQITMRADPDERIRRWAQDPFVAENTRSRVKLAHRPDASAKTVPADEAALLSALDAALWPAEVVRLAEQFLNAYPQSESATGARVALDGARQAATILRSNGVELFPNAFEAAPGMSSEALEELRRAARGDKDAAARLARRYKGASGREAGRYRGWLQFAAALGNGIASYDLARYFRDTDEMRSAEQYEARALELGYTPPPTLPPVRSVR